MNRQSVVDIAQALSARIQQCPQYPGAQKGKQAKRRLQLPMSLKVSMLRSMCFSRVRAWATNAATEAVLRSTWERTPQTTLELANMLRDPRGSLRCPFGVDFVEESNAGVRADGRYRIPWWLALMELHGDGYRYGTNVNREMPYVFETRVGDVARRREAPQAQSQGASEHLLVVSDDLAQALMANPVFKHKVACHDLLCYALTSQRLLISNCCAVTLCPLAA